jgi:hypothetical protein
VARRAAAAGPWRRLALILLLVPLVALGVAAVQLVPSWEVATASHRAQLGYDWKTNYSLLPADLLQALLPGGLRPAGESRSVSSELNAYPGVLPLILAIHVLARPWDWRAGFHAAVGFVAVLLAFGSHHGLYHTAYDFLPGFTLFRIPARFVGVAGFTVAVLAGLGAEALLTGPRPHRLARTLRRLTLVAVAGGVPLALVLVWARTLPNALDFRFFASQYVMLALFLAGTALVVTWPGRAQPRARRAALLTVLLADLMFGAPPVTGSLQSPDIPPPPEREWLEAIRRTPEPLRLARLDHIQPQMLYRHGWGVVDGQSTFAPSAFLDLYVLAREHPPLLDLLNVRYVVGDHTAAALLTARPAGALGLREGAVRRFPLPPGAAPRELEIQSHVVHGLELPQGGVVATIHLVTADGGGHVLPIRAGIETAEWALDRPGIQARHRKAPTARSWPVPEGHLGHSYRATFRLPRGSVVSEVVLQGGRGPVVLVVERLTADAVALWPIPPDRGRMRQVTAGLYENTRALPRAFLVRHARSVPSAQLADHLRDLDPREEVLVDGPVPPGWSSRPRVGATPLPRVEIATYRPDHVVLETTTPEPAVLVLSDTFQRGWSAWDNGQRVPVIRADHALRAVFLAPGRHRVEFRYRQPSVYIGVGVTLATLAGLGVAGILAARHRRAPAP